MLALPLDLQITKQIYNSQIIGNKRKNYCKGHKIWQASVKHKNQLRGLSTYPNPF